MKASALFGAGWEDDSLEVLWREAGRAFCRLRRDDADVGRHAFIPIPSGAEHTTFESLNRFTHEYELREYLDPAWALRPLDLARERGQTMLVVEYTGGAPLDRLVRQQPMEIGQFLRLAVPLSSALGLCPRVPEVSHVSRRIRVLHVVDGHRDQQLSILYRLATFTFEIELDKRDRVEWRSIRLKMTLCSSSQFGPRSLGLPPIIMMMLPQAMR
jgi:hypothetical protein